MDTTGSKRIKVSFWTYSSDNGDGSSSCLFFATEKEAEAYAQTELEEMGQGGNEENIAHKTLEFDEDGKLLNGEPPYEIY